MLRAAPHWTAPLFHSRVLATEARSVVAPARKTRLFLDDIIWAKILKSLEVLTSPDPLVGARRYNRTTTSLFVDGWPGQACWSIAGDVTLLSPRFTSAPWKPSHGDVECGRYMVLCCANHLAQIRAFRRFIGDIITLASVPDLLNRLEAVPLCFKGSTPCRSQDRS